MLSMSTGFAAHGSAGALNFSTGDAAWGSAGNILLSAGTGRMIPISSFFHSLQSFKKSSQSLNKLLNTKHLDISSEFRHDAPRQLTCCSGRLDHA